MNEQEQRFRTEMELMEKTNGQLRRKCRDMENNEAQVQLEMLEVKNKMLELKLFNSDIVIWSNGIRQHNAYLMSHQTFLTKCQGNTSELKDG